MVHAVVGVLSASGGLGASTFTVALAARAARRFGVCVAVDGQQGSGGLDTTAALEHLPGLRWGDVAGSRGTADGAAVLAGLPAQDSLRVLAAGGGVAPVAVERAVVDGLAQVCPFTALDLGRRVDLVDLCTHLVLLVGTTARQLADAAAVAGDEEVPPDPVPRLVLRSGRRDPVDPEEVAGHLGLPLAGVLRDDPHVATDADRGRVPGTRARGTVERVADRVLEALDPAQERAPAGVAG